MIGPGSRPLGSAIVSVPRGVTRAGFLRSLALLALPAPGPGDARPQAVKNRAMATMHTRAIPATGEPLPVIGCGTWLGFDQAPGSTGYDELAGVVDALFAAGGKLIDSSPMYGRAEETVGELLAVGDRSARAFVATKVWTRGRAEGIRQMTRSMQLLRRVDLMQIHNLVDWKAQLPTLREWKAAGRIRYLGITHYSATAHAEVEAVLKAEPLDFVQIDYALDDRQAERRLLPLAAERGVGVIVNMPFGGGGLLRRLSTRPLPGWAAEIGCASWAQMLLKFVLSQPAVTCAIPGTRRADHMADNARAGLGVIPEPGFWRGKIDALAG